ncbi:MAG TPA: ABC transporter permease [Aggregatilineaceae bacterium]|jgi:peptide/nickel transport system permease protein|nr:ABC transporter permease [Aggregatilineaceae bacterium]
MLTYIVRRLILIAVVLVGLSILTFTITRMIPADPVRLAAGPRASKQQVEALRQQYGYDKPFVQQYFQYTSDLLHGDLGRSVVLQREVGPDLRRYFPATLELVLTALLIAVALGVPLGLISAVYRDHWPDQIARVVSLGGVSLPSFWLAILLQIKIAFEMGWVPISGRFSRIAVPPESITGLYALDSLLTLNFGALRVALTYLILPALCLSFGALATVARTVRADALEVLGTDYIRTARAIGIPESAVILKYTLKNASLNALTQVGLFFGYTITGSVLVENIFSWPGVGQYAVSRALEKDYVPLMGVTLLLGLAIVLVNLVTDLLYAVLDPRIRYAT